MGAKWSNCINLKPSCSRMAALKLCCEHEILVNIFDKLKSQTKIIRDLLNLSIYPNKINLHPKHVPLKKHDETIYPDFFWKHPNF